MAEAILTAAVIGMSVDEVLTTGRLAIQEHVKNSTQTALDRYQSGVQVTSANIMTITLDKSVAQAFQDVVNAQADRDKKINEAKTYVNNTSDNFGREVVARARRFQSCVAQRNQGWRCSMRLLQSVLATLPQTRKPQRKFITHLLGLVLMLPGHATFRNLSRYSSCHERTFARWYDRPFDFVSLNKAAITQVIPPEHQQALVIDASFIPKSGTRTYGLEHFRNSRHRRSEKGLEVSAVAWLDITDNCACGLSVEQTPPSDKTSEPQGTRIDACLEQLRGVVCDHHLKHLRHVIADGYYSKRKFLDGVRALGLHQIGKLRRDANLRYFYQGLGHPGPGRPKTHDGKVQWDDLSRFERVQSEDDDVVLYHQVLNHVHLRRNLRVVLVVDTRTQRRAVLFSTDTDLDAQTLYRWVQSALPRSSFSSGTPGSLRL